MLSLPKSFPRSRLLRVLVVVFILAIAAVPVIPNYLTGSWPWENPPRVQTIQQLRELGKQGLVVSGWQTLDQQVANIGGHRWSVQTIVPEQASDQFAPSTPVVLMLRPQTAHRDQPQVDWMDINGAQRWTADSQRQAWFTVETPLNQASAQPSVRPVQVEARFLRGWSHRQTYAVLQWYAWSTGGNPAPSRWFWVDQMTQWREDRRMPWVAVSVLIPIQPLGDIEQARAVALSLGQSIQSALMQHALNPYA